ALNMSTTTSRPLSDWKVNGAMKRVAAAVMITSTSAPAWRSLLQRSAALNAAMLPVTPSAIWRPESGSRGMSVPDSFRRTAKSLSLVTIHLVDEAQPGKCEVELHDVDRVGELRNLFGPAASGDDTDIF